MIKQKRNNPGLGVFKVFLWSAGPGFTLRPLISERFRKPRSMLSEREDEMRKEITYNFDENDDIANMIDAVLTAPGFRSRYEKEGPENWIGMIGDQDMEDGLRSLPKIEQEIIEMCFLQRKTLVDISKDLDLTPDLLMGHLKAIRMRLELCV